MPKDWPTEKPGEEPNKPPEMVKLEVPAGIVKTPIKPKPLNFPPTGR